VAVFRMRFEGGPADGRMLDVACPVATLTALVYVRVRGGYAEAFMSTDEETLARANSDLGWAAYAPTPLGPESDGTWRCIAYGG